MRAQRILVNFFRRCSLRSLRSLFALGIASRRVGNFVRGLADLHSWDAIRLWVVVISETIQFLAVSDGFKQHSADVTA